MQDTPLWRRMADHLEIPADLVAGVLASLQQRFGLGVAWDLAFQPWLVNLESVTHFASTVKEFLSGTDASASDGCIQYFAPEVGELVCQMVNVVVNHEGELIATADEGGTVSLFKRSNDGTFKTDRDVTRFTLPARALDFSADDR